MKLALDPNRGAARFAALHTFSPALLRSALDTIGATPMVSIQMILPDGERQVFLKLEGGNLTGSIKDRTALSLVDDLRRRGHARPGTTLIESTSGNLGVALSVLAQAHRLRFVAVVDPNVSPENRAKMEALGAVVEVVDRADAGGYLTARLERVRALCDRNPSYVWTNQYGSPSNPRAHLTSTAPEILRQLRGRLDAVFVAVSTCGTLAGIGTYLRAASPSTRIVAVDACGSTIFGGPASPRLLVGVGSSRPPSFELDGLYDDVVHVTDADAFACCRALGSQCGLFVGGSSGAVLAACARYAAQLKRGARVVCVCPDSGDNYLSTIWSDEWLHDHGIDARRPPAGLGFRRIGA